MNNIQKLLKEADLNKLYIYLIKCGDFDHLTVAEIKKEAAKRLK